MARRFERVDVFVHPGWGIGSPSAEGDVRSRVLREYLDKMIAVARAVADDPGRGAVVLNCPRHQIEDKATREAMLTKGIVPLQTRPSRGSLIGTALDEYGEIVLGAQRRIIHGAYLLACVSDALTMFPELIDPKDENRFRIGYVLGLVGYAIPAGGIGITEYIPADMSWIHSLCYGDTRLYLDPREQEPDIY